MKIEFTIDKRDFLIYQLYTASKSGKIRKIRSRLTYLISFIYICLGVLFLAKNDPKISIVFFSISILWYLLIPIYIRKRILHNYSKYIDAHYANRYGKKATFIFEEEYIESKSIMGETKFKISDIISLDETGDYCYIRFSSGVSIIIPKRKIENFSALREKLDQIIAKLKITPAFDINWTWK